MLSLLLKHILVTENVCSFVRSFILSFFIPRCVRLIVLWSSDSVSLQALGGVVAQDYFYFK